MGWSLHITIYLTINKTSKQGHKENKKYVKENFYSWLLNAQLHTKHLPVESKLLALVLLPNTESKSTLRP